MGKSYAAWAREIPSLPSEGRHINPTDCESAMLRVPVYADMVFDALSPVSRIRLVDVT